MINRFEAYAFFSYLPDIPRANIHWLPYDEDKEGEFASQPERYWIDRGVRALNEMMLRQIETVPPGATHVVPLSSGLDSRAILGWLSENLPASQIVTITYGIPGAWDYEIAPLLARKTGVRHERMDLSGAPWDLDHLMQTGAGLKHPARVFWGDVPRRICEHFGQGCVFWSGFLAGSLAGVHLPPIPSADRLQAARLFVRHNRTPHFKDDAFADEMAQKIVLEYPWEENQYQKKMGLDQQLDYGIRHRHYIRSVLLVDGYSYRAPFTSKPWLSFILNVPYPLLLGEGMYKKVLLSRFPDLYRLPVRNNAGLPLTAGRAWFFLSKAYAKLKPRLFPKDPYRSHPRTNYINFTESMRHPTRFQEVVRCSIQDLKERGIFPQQDLDTGWNDHLNRKANNTVLLLNLASLEILLKSDSI
jgi:hypothetical protein